MAKKPISTFRIESRLLHSDYPTEQITRALSQPIYTTSTYEQSAPGEHLGFDYSRSHNPTRFALEHAVAESESGKAGFAFSSGMAAINTILDTLDAGSHVIVTDDVYGGTFRLMDGVKQRTNQLQVSWVDFSDLTHLESALQDNTRMIWIETPSNPLLKIVDLNAVIAWAKQRDLMVVVDNTFATPILQRPLELGADVVVHSATKYLNGHCDVICGVAVVGNNEALAERIGFLQNSAGAIAGPFDSFLVMRGMKTLALRIKKQCENAMAIAQHFAEHPALSRVIYPGLPNHPGHSIAAQQMSAYGGMLCLDIKGGEASAREFVKHLSLFTLAESLGGVSSLINHPAIMTHASIPEPQREKLGITGGLLRLSVGIEHPDDLINELQQALTHVPSH